MKKILIGLTIFTISLTASAQQAQFGLTAGYTNVDLRAKDDFSDGLSMSQDESGFYIGAIADISITANFNIQPEMLYARVNETNFLYIPVLAKLYIAGSGFHVLGGPQANIFLDNLDGGPNYFGLDLSFGAGYDINEHFFIDARYSFELTNRISGDIPDGSDDSLRANTLNVGVGYKF